MNKKLTALAEDIWSIQSSHTLLGIDFGGRMTVIRLASGDLFLHSPVRLTDSLREELNALGNVKHLVAPNRFHHLNVGDYVKAYPEAELYAAPGLPEKRRDIKFTGVLSDGTEYGWGDEVEHLLFGGIPLLNEVVFFHPESATLILADLIFNFSHDLSTAQRIFARIDDVYMEPRVSRLTRLLFLKNREKARKSADRILSWDFDRVLVAHKDMVEKGGYEAVRKALGCFG
ncbi:MAG: DUF4336 domain-containing protein [Deltaproteobacteria bacterium]